MEPDFPGLMASGWKPGDHPVYHSLSLFLPLISTTPISSHLGSTGRTWCWVSESTRKGKSTRKAAGVGVERSRPRDHSALACGLQAFLSTIGSSFQANLAQIEPARAEVPWDRWGQCPSAAAPANLLSLSLEPLGQPLGLQDDV